jgi:hypothetical protein
MVSDVYTRVQTCPKVQAGAYKAARMRSGRRVKLGFVTGSQLFRKFDIFNANAQSMFLCCFKL